jgi:hypothetical protein
VCGHAVQVVRGQLVQDPLRVVVIMVMVIMTVMVMVMVIVMVMVMVIVTVMNMLCMMEDSLFRITCVCMS